MATNDTRYRKRHYGLMSEEDAFQLDRAIRITLQGRVRAVRCDRKYETNVARQKAYRERQKAKQQPLTRGQWELIAAVFVLGLEGQTPARRESATLALNTLLRCHRTGLIVELSER